ncbi:tigger transposable element-derived protein 4 [Trichonephila clavipes]|nr:tigger transposable element-derived protein 4 [Trichonephila clavipes]
MTAQWYAHDILQPHVLPLIQRLPGSIFQQDNARPQTTRMSQDFLRTVTTLHWPALSPDLSPIEHIWDHLGSSKLSRRKCYSIKQNILILQEVGKGVKKKDFVLKFGIPLNNLSTIIKNRYKLHNYDSSNSSSKRLRTCVYEDVDEAVLKLIHIMLEKRDKDVPISRSFVIEKALQCAKTLGYDQFLGSNRWLEKFQKRH